MANNQRCICRSHEPVDQARVNFLVIRFRDLLPLTALHHCIDNRKVKQPFHNLSENIHICITNDHHLWFQGTRRWRDIFIDSKVNLQIYLSMHLCPHSILAWKSAQLLCWRPTTQAASSASEACMARMDQLKILYLRNASNGLSERTLT